MDRSRALPRSAVGEQRSLTGVWGGISTKEWFKCRDWKEVKRGGDDRMNLSRSKGWRSLVVEIYKQQGKMDSEGGAEGERKRKEERRNKP